MVNIIIYLKKEYNAKELVKHLLLEKLIASASIDESNTYYELENNEFTQKVNSVITVQSKALLFNEVIHAVNNKIGEVVPIISMPIVGTLNLELKQFEYKTVTK